MSKFLNLSISAFTDYLKKENIHRFYFVYDQAKRRLTASHTQLQPVADFIQADQRDFLEHEGMFFQVSSRYDVLQGAFIHRTNRGQAAGGVRYWLYQTVEDYLRDGLRLGKGMTRKNALAGLWWGGGKGVMAHNPALDKQDPLMRASLYTEYGAFISSLKGCYVTAEDVGTHVTDMANVFSKTRFTTCIPPSYGGSGNPSAPTARGVICGMEAALAFINAGTLEGKTVAVQGMGNVGEPLIRFLFGKKVHKVIACDLDAALIERVKSEFAGKNLETTVVRSEDDCFLSVACDILSPCATGAILNPQSIPDLRTSIICGAANNQLADSDRDDRVLLDKGIVYVPDFLTNRMGIVNAANEQYGYVNEDPLFERHLTRDWEFSIYQTALRVLKESRKTNDPPAKVAIGMAEALSIENHPIFGHRGVQIIRSLVENRWHEQN